MYKFTNGIVVFDEKTKNEFIKAGYRLVENHIAEAGEMVEEVENAEDNTSDRPISEGHKKPKKSTRKN